MPTQREVRRARRVASPERQSASHGTTERGANALTDIEGNGEPFDRFSLDRSLIDATRHWRECDMRRCRRAQCCAIPEMPCRKKNEAALRWWKRRVYIPYLRERWPTVQWGAPAGTMEPQLEAARAAEAQKAQQGTARSRRVRPKQRRGRRRRRPAACDTGAPAIND